MKRIEMKFIIIVITGIISYISFTFAWYPSCNSMILSLNSNFSNLSEFWSVREISQHFCEHVHDSKCEDKVNSYDSDYFDANQSVFLSLLCDNVWRWEKFTSIKRTKNESILKKTKFSHFNIYNRGISDVNHCDKKMDMNGCDFYRHLPKMFNEIINDYFNIGQSRIYWIKWFQGRFDSKSAANEFSEENFLIRICDPENKDYYNTSCKYLSNYLNKANKLLRKTKVIDTKKLTEQGGDINCENRFSKNILYCGLLGSNNANDDFLNAIYNEYLRYRLFMEYYSKNLSSNPKLSNIQSNLNSEKLANNKEKIVWVQQNNVKIREALSSSLRTISEISQTFPLHIWLTMYQENAHIFMKELSKIYPPIRTLSDKLQNVQKAE